MAPTTSRQRGRILLCSSPKERAYAQELQTHLASAVGTWELELWEEPLFIQAAGWREDLASAVALADVAFLLISEDFLASRATKETLLPLLLDAYQRTGLALLPVFIAPCPLQETPLAQFQAVNDASQPLSKMTAAERAAVWDKMAFSVKWMFSALDVTQTHTAYPDPQLSYPGTMASFTWATPDAPPPPPDPGSSTTFLETPLSQDDTLVIGPTPQAYDPTIRITAGPASSAPGSAVPTQAGSFSLPAHLRPIPPRAGGGWLRGLRFPFGSRDPVSISPPAQSVAAPLASVEPASAGTYQPTMGTSSRTPITESPHFTAFAPERVTAGTWNTLLVYTHIASALEQVRQDARKFQPEMGERQSEPEPVIGKPVARGTELTLVPSGDGMVFNPPRLSFQWVEDWQPFAFRFWVNKGLSLPAATGTISVCAGVVLIATVRFGLLIDGRPLPESAKKPAVETSSATYQRVFTSYSHKDTPVVLACRNVFKAFGWEVLIDVDTLRAGQLWNDELKRMIDRSDMFQLFWSARSAKSAYVRQEWEYALSLKRGVGFIRPVFWEQPQEPPPAALKHLHFDELILPRLDLPLSAYDQAIQSDPGNAIAYHAKGDALSEQQRYEEALLAYHQALILESGYSPAWSSLGNAYYGLHLFVAALDALDRAIQTQPYNALAYIRKVATLVQLQRYEEALLASEQALRLNPWDVSTYNNRGAALLMLGRYEEARAAYQQAIQIHPTYGLSYSNLGAALTRLGRREEAAQAYQWAYKLAGG